MAKAMCEADGRRLCQTQAEINKCCGRGCMTDRDLVWTGISRTKVTETAEKFAEEKSSTFWSYSQLVLYSETLPVKFLAMVGVISVAYYALSTWREKLQTYMEVVDLEEL